MQTIAPYIGTDNELIFLGDLIDRSPDKDGDKKVINTVRLLQDNPSDYGLSKVTVLSGNHENLVVRALTEGPSSPAYRCWEANGGNTSLLPFYRTQLEWLYNLPTHTIRDNYLFVHAGVRPNIPLEKQKSEDLMWIREPFLTQNHNLPYIVVHGHTINEGGPEVLPHRINLDTGAFYTNVLSTIDIELPIS